MRPIRLATRASPLAQWQARHVARLLRRAWPGLSVRLVPVASSGDRDLSTPLYGMGDVGVFAREVHAAVLDDSADAAVHSCKDLPTTPPDGVAMPVIPPRHDPRDALVGAADIAALPRAALVGSSSLRRRTQLGAIRPDLRFTSIRGNIQTRIGKTTDGTVDATLLACAGLRRMGLMRVAGARALHPRDGMVPAPAQGAIAVDHRCDDHRTAVLLAALHETDSARAVALERAVLAGLRGGCSLPLGCYATRTRATWHLTACLADETGLRRAAVHGPHAGLADRCLEDLLRDRRP